MHLQQGGRCSGGWVRMCSGGASSWAGCRRESGLRWSSRGRRFAMPWPGKGRRLSMPWPGKGRRLTTPTRRGWFPTLRPVGEEVRNRLCLHISTVLARCSARAAFLISRPVIGRGSHVCFSLPATLGTRSIKTSACGMVACLGLTALDFCGVEGAAKESHPEHIVS